MLLINDEFLFARLFRLLSSLINSLKIQVFFHEIFPD
ncbi:hypothetical protein J2S02_002752 [Metabacillus niabensis]|uniref:Uncharacterized protein n=1 Tax=Metabacillus niabensis TaxID=324854 RepID=A0ABT9Z2C9_9BACI|nr:hypothetical protein [Metabacillus niabensis]